jgi:hypothetical protein
MTKLTTVEQTEIVDAAKRTWNAIAYDVLNAVREGGGNKMPASHVVEVILDADHIRMYGGTLSENAAAALKYPISKSVVTLLKKHFTAEYV